MSTAALIRAHTRAILRARAAYTADRMVAAGRCADCWKPHNEPKRRCWQCRKKAKP